MNEAIAVLKDNEVVFWYDTATSAPEEYNNPIYIHEKRQRPLLMRLELVEKRPVCRCKDPSAEIEDLKARLDKALNQIAVLMRFIGL